MVAPDRFRWNGALPTRPICGTGAVAMALKFPNVYLGTGAYPPRHWDPAVVSFLKGPGRRKVLFGSNFPTVGHTKALEQVAELGLDEATQDALLGGTARRVFTRLDGGTA